MKRLCKHIFLVLLVLFFASAMANAQDPTMTLLDGGLNFGNNITGTTTIAYSNSNSASYEIQFTNYTNATASVTFLLPTYLTDSYGDRLPISFATNSGIYSVGTNTQNGGTQYNPNTGIINAAVNAGAHNDYFWLGGTITPGNNYTAASYSGTITASITVTVGSNQYSASLDIPVTATLQGNVSLSASGTLDFGQIVAGTTPPVLSALAAGAPQFIAGGVRTRSTVQFPATALLNDGYGNTMTFTPSLYGSRNNTQSGAASMSSGQTLGGTTAGHFYFWLGGSLSAPPSNQAAGTYGGVFAIRITY
jgi:Domain of unknown function (DUF4402)